MLAACTPGAHPDVTFVVTLAAGSMVVQVSDRLLTQDRREWDPLANKSVVFLGTDQWLAETLSERDTAIGPRGAPAIRMDTGFVPRLGPCFARLAEAIDADFGRQPADQRSLGMHVLVAGFLIQDRRSSRPKVRPFMQRYSHHGHDGDQVVRRSSPRYWNWNRDFPLVSIGANPGDARQQAITDLASPGDKNQDDCERILLNYLRSVHANDRTVGADCVSIVLSRYGDVRVRFLPEPGSDRGLSAYTPWIVAPGMVIPPSVLAGNLPSVNAGGYTVEFDRVPALAPSDRLEMYGQRRKSPPS
jgi:hypothetical protein